jgi:3-phosphoshikimate 1-carboxyvinyltransferase
VEKSEVEGTLDKTIRPGAVHGTVRMPGDKSISHRALMFGALAEGASRARNVADSADCRATRRIIQMLGARVRDIAPGELEIEGPGLANLTEPADVLDAANSGTTTRLMAGILASRPFYSVISGDASLRGRPMARVVEPLTRMGAAITGREGGRLLPLTITGGSLRAIDYRLPVASAQVKSAVLLAGLGAAGTTRVREPAPSRDHTERMLRYLGAPVRDVEGAVEVDGGATLRPFSLDVPGDISSAAFFLAAGLLAPESAVTIPGVGANTTRTGVLDALRAMDGEVAVTEEETSGPEPVATLTARSSRLRGTEIGGALIPRLLDELPLLALVATQARGQTVVRDAAELRVKESDRIATTAGELRRLGADITETPDGFIVQGPTPLRGARCQSHSDHRIAMMLAVAGLIAEGETVIEGAECVEVSFPGFFDVLQSVVSHES